MSRASQTHQAPQIGLPQSGPDTSTPVVKITPTSPMVNTYGDPRIDVVAALLLAATREEARGQVYNLGNDEIVSLGDLARLLVELNGGGDWRLVPFPSDRAAIDIGDFWADFRKIERELGWRPTIELREGLTETLHYYREHGPSHYWDGSD